MLRYQAPIQINNRQASSDTLIADIFIPKGTTVHLKINAANRDPQLFDKPDQFDIARTPNRHLSFGLGIHICAGNNLARLEAKIAFQRFAKRFPKARLLSEPQIARRIRFREIERLPIAMLSHPQLIRNLPPAHRKGSHLARCQARFCLAN